MEKLLSNEAAKLLKQIAKNDARDPIDTTTAAAQELLQKFYYIRVVEIDARGSRGITEAMHWVRVTNRGKEWLGEHGIAYP